MRSTEPLMKRTPPSRSTRATMSETLSMSATMRSAIRGGPFRRARARAFLAELVVRQRGGALRDRLLEVIAVIAKLFPALRERDLGALAVRDVLDVSLSTARARLVAYGARFRDPDDRAVAPVDLDSNPRRRRWFSRRPNSARRLGST
jgi:hypothetical protein